MFWLHCQVFLLAHFAVLLGSSFTQKILEVPLLYSRKQWGKSKEKEKGKKHTPQNQTTACKMFPFKNYYTTS